jgi:hypothetical protein
MAFFYAFVSCLHSFFSNRFATILVAFFGVLSQIAPRVATIRRKFGENLWNLPEIVISLQCRSDKQHLSGDMFNNLKL